MRQTNDAHDAECKDIQNQILAAEKSNAQLKAATKNLQKESQWYQQKCDSELQSFADSTTNFAQKLKEAENRQVSTYTHYEKSALFQELQQLRKEMATLRPPANMNEVKQQVSDAKEYLKLKTIELANARKQLEDLVHFIDEVKQSCARMKRAADIIKPD
eukprot:TRINITY_DN10565_c0_g1_i1.p1 TRINITY_DN10565_c0_g1~~TRINITY_DN10565_c0_g1_i1.p1  ORF type:complete len:160 (+),score=38.79 TRINITY_DN10565_c0_g1_i1:104-583(+)